MREQWRDVIGFPDYVVSNYGEVYDTRMGRIIKQSRVAGNLLRVQMVRGGKQNCRSVAVLVATAFLERQREDFTTVVHLDGDKSNCRADNLVWRPRHITVRYHRERQQPPKYPDWKAPFEHVGTGEHFTTIADAAMRFGLLQNDVVLAIINNTFAPPTEDRFRLLEE